MKRTTLLLATLALAGIIETSTPIYAQEQTSVPDIPRIITYQGMITTESGNPIINGEYPIVVTMYADQEGTQKIWEGSYTTALYNGIFDLQLGSGEHKLPDSRSMDRPIWVGVRIDGGQEMRPLTLMSASPYSMNVADGSVTANKIATGAVTADKIDADYISEVRINGEKVTGKGTPLNLVSSDDIELRYDQATGSLKIASSTGTHTEGKQGAGILGTATDGWGMRGDGIAPGTHAAVPSTNNDWIGTSTAINFTMKVNGVQTMLYQPSGVNTPNIVGGHSTNVVNATAEGSIIAGGGGPGGTNNGIYGTYYNTISGGRVNNIFQEESDYNVIGGGDQNYISLNVNPVDYSTLSGGLLNKIDADKATIGGGSYNHAMAVHATVGGGYDNEALAVYSTIAGGEGNEASGDISFVGGGQDNYATLKWSTVAGGHDNQSTGSAAFIGGGEHNIASGISSTIGSGYGNATSAIYSSILGGHGNSVTVNGGTIGGGYGHQVLDAYGSILGGQSNTINQGAANSAIGGGVFNTINAEEATISGGGASTITAAGRNSAIPGGDLLMSQSYAQVVLGYYNIARGSMPYRPSGALTAATDDPLLIIGNGDVGGATRAQAFEVSYNGHSTVFDVNGPTFGGGRDPIRGATYVDNVIYAWGEIQPAGAVASDFGVTNVVMLGPGIYRVTINVVDPMTGAQIALTQSSVTATLIDQGGDAQPITCASITATPLKTIGANLNTFVVKTGLILPGGSCEAVDLPFMFKVTGRP